MAYQAFEEDRWGSVTVGRRADLVWLGSDPYVTDPAGWPRHRGARHLAGRRAGPGGTEPDGHPNRVSAPDFVVTIRDATESLVRDDTLCQDRPRRVDSQPGTTQNEGSRGACTSSSPAAGAPARSGEPFEVTDPATGETVERVVLADGSDVDSAVAAARAAFPAWSGAPPVERSAALTRLAAILASAPATWPAPRHGRPASRSGSPPGSTSPAPRQRRVLRRRGPSLEGKAAGEYSGDHTSYVRREAIGVVGSVAPWNYPLQMAAWKVLPAVAAGNTIVLKPAELTPLTALMFAEAATEAGMPGGVVNVVTGTGRVAGEALMGHPTSTWSRSPGPRRWAAG